MANNSKQPSDYYNPMEQAEMMNQVLADVSYLPEPIVDINKQILGELKKLNKSVEKEFTSTENARTQATLSSAIVSSEDTKQTTTSQIIDGEQTPNTLSFVTGLITNGDKAINSLITDVIGPELLGVINFLGSALNNLTDRVNHTVSSIANVESNLEIYSRRTRAEAALRYAGGAEWWDKEIAGIEFGSEGRYTATEYYSNANKLMEAGYQLENDQFRQMSELLTIQDKLSLSFDAMGANVRNIARIQEDDLLTVAQYRLGLNLSLNKILTEATHSTEYLQTLSDSVASTLYESEAWMGAEDALNFDYAVQKWMGMLYNEGASSAFITSLTRALNDLGTGNVSTLTQGGTGTLLAKAAARSGLSYSSMMISGLQADDVNTLMQAVIEELALSGTDNNVISRSLANLFGANLSDITAALRVGSSSQLSAVATSDLSNIADLFESAYDAIGSSMSQFDIAKNVFSNIGYDAVRNLVSDMSSDSLGQMGGSGFNYLKGYLLSSMGLTELGTSYQTMALTSALKDAIPSEFTIEGDTNKAISDQLNEMRNLVDTSLNIADGINTLNVLIGDFKLAVTESISRLIRGD